MTDSRRDRLREIAALFLRLGFTAFGGPAAHVAWMEDEVVRRRAWLTRAAFLDLVGAANLIPGPNSTELAIHLGYVRAGMPGLLLAGACFILPAALITGVLAWAYARFHYLPALGAALYGVKPAVIAIIGAALVRFSRTIFLRAAPAPAPVPEAMAPAAVTDASAPAAQPSPPRRIQLLAIAIALACCVASLAGADELALLLAGGIAGMLPRLAARPRGAGRALAPLLAGPLIAGGAASASAPTLLRLFLFFLKIGSVLYGSGYVLLAFLRGGLVLERGWLTEQQLLDAIAVGQVTPGPLFSTATFVGYLLLGWRGAAVATAGIFLPSFVLVALTAPLIPRLRRSRPLGAFLDGVNAASIGLMVAVTVLLARDAIPAWPAAAIALAAAGALAIAPKLNPTWVLAGGAAIGLLLGAAP